MNDRAKADHHPLPEDARARHDLLPENIEDARDKGDDAPDDAPSSTEPPTGEFKNPDGSPYPS